MAKKKVKKGTKKTAKKKVVKKAAKKKAKKRAAKKTTKKKGTKATPPPVTVPVNEKTAEEELTVNQKRFGDEWLMGGKAGPAYKKIYKCSTKAAEANASRLLSTLRMQSYLQKRIANMQTSISVSVENILRECGRIALADPIDAFTDDGGIKRIQDINVDLRRSISGFEVKELWEGTGKDRKKIGEIKKIKFWSKANQLGLLARHLGLLEKGNRGHSAEDELVNLMEEISGNGAGLPIRGNKK